MWKYFPFSLILFHTSTGGTSPPYFFFHLPHLSPLLFSLVDSLLIMQEESRKGCKLALTGICVFVRVLTRWNESEREKKRWRWNSREKRYWMVRARMQWWLRRGNEKRETYPGTHQESTYKIIRYQATPTTPSYPPIRNDCI